MNDAIREKLSAYLDGALLDSERATLEGELSRSEEMRLELEALRAVSASVKGLPKEPLPAGFMARLEARRARDAKPERDYLILPPAYRPLAFVLSTAVVALVVWDKTRAPEQLIAPRVGWDSETVAVKSAAEAPPSIDVSGQLSAMGSRDKGLDDLSSGSAESAAANELAAQTAKKEDDAGAKAGVASTFGKHISAPGKPLEVQEADGPASAEGGFARRAAPSAPGAAAPAPAPSALGDGGSSGYLARSEEERSAINERLYQGFEEEKKRMGIAKIMDKDEDEPKLAGGGREYMLLQASPEAARVDRARGAVGAVRGAAKAKGGAPVVKALTLKSAEALSAAWAAAGLPGEPPAVAFPEQMAVFLAGPAGCGITDVQNRKKFIVVLYKDAGFDDPSARVRAVTLSPKPVVVKLAP
ncbi:MAG: hypothetical protein HYV14_11860 [Elusimicrobia bacterium]|nr:hypothetical protein [Elusimicrobiota bacterium]